MLIAPPSPAAKLLLNSEFLIVQLDEPTSNAIAPPLNDAVLSMNLQLSTLNIPWEVMAPPSPSLFPLINVIPCSVTVAPLAILNILAL